MDELNDIAIRNEASLLRNIFYNTSMGIIETDLGFNIRLANPAARKMLADGKNLMDLSLRDLIREREQLDKVTNALCREELKRYEGKWTPDKTDYHTQIKVVLTLARDNYYAVTGFLAMCEELVFHTACCVCGKVKTPDGWVTMEEMVDRSAALSHTLCPECMPKAIEDVQKHAEKRRRAEAAAAEKAQSTIDTPTEGRL